MGGNRFMAAWVEAENPGSISSTATGPLNVRFYNVDGNWESEPQLLQEDARGVQSLATGPIDFGPCVFKADDLPEVRGPETGTSHAFRSFIAVYGGSGASTNLKIYKIDWCGGVPEPSIVQEVNSAKLGALTGRRVCGPALCTQEMLVVYERMGLRGRLMNESGLWMGSEFMIDEDVGERRYIDITSNPVSQQFFVGYNVIGGGFKECSVRQAAVANSGTATSVRTLHQACDSGHGGHRSASSTDDNLIRNPTGQYLWYHQSDVDGNNVYLMDNAGGVIRRLDLGQGLLQLPIPVALANVHKVAGPSYAVNVQIVGAPNVPQYVFLTLAADGSILSTQQRAAGEPLAVEALADKIVTATGENCLFDGLAGRCPSWFISVYDR
jgi:hypothetical protein